jgi:hypothetical protein
LLEFVDLQLLDALEFFLDVVPNLLSFALVLFDYLLDVSLLLRTV